MDAWMLGYMDAWHASAITVGAHSLPVEQRAALSLHTLGRLYNADEYVT